MARINAAGYHARHGFEQVAHGGWLEKLTRVGFACKGLVYFLIGVLALMAAFNEGGETTDTQGVLMRVAEQPFGMVALVIIGIGLLAYALWRFVSAVKDTEGEGSDMKGLAKRAGYCVSGFVYAAAAILAFQLVAGNGGGQGNTGQTWTARILDAPGGTFLVAAIGVAIIVAGIMQIRHGFQEKFLDKMRTGEMSPTEHEWTARAGKWGYSARGIVFGIIGTFFIMAAVRHSPGEVRGMEGALDRLAAQPFGTWLLAAVALGLMCYGVYSVMAARYRTVRH